MGSQKLECNMISAEDTSHDAGEAVTNHSEDILKLLDKPQEQSSDLIEKDLRRIDSTSSPLGDTRKENSTEHKTRDDLSFSIRCRDEEGTWSQPYAMPENPFDDSTLLREKPSAPMVIEIFVEVDGIGLTYHWDINSFQPRKGKRSADDVETPDHGSDSHDDHESPPGTGHQQHTRNRPKVQNSLTRALNSGYFRALYAKVREIRIHSKNLIRILRAVVEHYPGQSFEGDQISVRRPFPMIAHYFDELSELKQRCNESSETKARVLKCLLEPNQGRSGGKFKERTERERDEIFQAAFHDLDVLLGYYKRELILDMRTEERKFKLGLVSYHYLWLLFEPGSIVYAWVGGKLAGFIFDSGREINDGGRYWWEARCWNLSYNGHRIVTNYHSFKIGEFLGDREMTELSVFPSKYYDNHEKTQTYLQELGEKFYGIVRDCPAHLQYSGPCWDGERKVYYTDPNLRRPDTEYEGEVVIDHRQTQSIKRGTSENRPMHRSRSASPDYSQGNYRLESDQYTQRVGFEDEDFGDCPALDTKNPATTFNPMDPKTQRTLTKLHYFLMPRKMNGLALAQKQKMLFDVECIQPIAWPPADSDQMSSLILEESDKDVIRALTRKYARGESWGADYIKGKGEGQIFLLHGPPGTGKTYTVECVAKATRRPLLRLTVADIGTNEREMEYVLGEWFQRCTDWGAIILIDEADVFLEKRQTRDLQRNSLVSVFLSCMEYYTGMLFLTTNRIGQIDDAFLSRISVALTYKPLDIGKQQLIWQGFLKKLGEERKDIILTDRAKKFLEGLSEEETVKNVPWNGREIRNALQSAIALAGNDAEREARATGERPKMITIRDEHFQTVVDRRKEFVEYRKSIRNQDEDTRAYQEGSRAPPMKKRRIE